MKAGERRKRGAGLWRLIVFVTILAVLIIIGTQLPVKDYLLAFLEWTEGLGIWGPVVVIVFYVAACVLMLPGSILTLGAGLLFGVIWGTVTVSVASTIGASAAFLVGRTLARDFIERRVSANPGFKAMDTAVGHEGFKIVLLLRLSPVFPFNLLNYGLGLTRVKFGHYVLASWIGMLPGTVMYVYFGSVMRSLAQVVAGDFEGGSAQRVFFWVGLAVTVLVTIFVTRVAQRALKEAIEGRGGANAAS